MPKENPNLALVRRDFYADIYKNHIDTKRHIETKIQWVLGASAIIFGLTVSYLPSSTNPGVFIISFSSLAAFLVCLYAFEPINAFIHTSKHNKADVMFYKSFQDLTPHEYSRLLLAANTEKKIAEQYADDIMNMVKRRLLPMKKLCMVATRTLLLGTLLGIIILLATL
jgi:hypothetical protein